MGGSARRGGGYELCINHVHKYFFSFLSGLDFANFLTFFAPYFRVPFFGRFLVIFYHFFGRFWPKFRTRFIPNPSGCLKTALHGGGRFSLKFRPDFVIFLVFYFRKVPVPVQVPVVKIAGSSGETHRKFRCSGVPVLYRKFRSSGSGGKRFVHITKKKYTLCISYINFVLIFSI